MEPIGIQSHNVSTWMWLGWPDHASRQPARRALSSGRKELSRAKRIRALSSVPGAAGGYLSSDSGDGRGDRGKYRSRSRMTGERDQAVLDVEALAALAPRPFGAFFGIEFPGPHPSGGATCQGQVRPAGTPPGGRPPRGRREPGYVVSPRTRR